MSGQLFECLVYFTNKKFIHGAWGMDFGGLFLEEVKRKLCIMVATLESELAGRLRCEAIFSSRVGQQLDKHDETHSVKK